MIDYRKLARKDARKYKLNPGVFTRQIGTESGFNPAAVSPAGARGIAQFEPSTARGLGVNPDDPVAALDAAARLMRSYLDRYGSYRDALVAYNAGPGRVGGPPPGETRRYLATILGGAPGPQAPAGRAAPTAGGTLKATPQETFDQAAYDQAQKRFILAGLIARTQGTKSPLFASGLLSTTPPAPGEFIKTGLKVTGAPRAPSAPTPRAQGGMVLSRAKPGDPVARGTGIGGVHPTAGLPGYPARDYFAPAGSPAVAPVTGTVFKLSGHDPKLGPVEGAGGPLGWSVYIRGTDGRDYFLTHMGSRNVRVGQKVHQGQKIGTVANYHSYGRPDHIHLGVHG